MDDANVGALADESLGTASTAGSRPGALGYLNGEWVNTRIENVMQKASAILDRLIDKGLLADGFGPFESPITDDMLMRMTPEQFSTLYETLTSEEEKGALLAKMKGLKMPVRLLMPKPTPTLPHTPPLAMSGHEQVSSGTSV